MIAHIRIALISIVLASAPLLWAKADPFEGVEKILIIGNSISRHHVKPSIGWTTHWGMAASAKEKDYVHILMSELDRRYPAHKHTYEIIRLKNEAKMTGVEHLLNKKADLVIIQHGENFRGQNTVEELVKPYEQVIAQLKQHVTSNIICVGAWSLNGPRAKERSDLLRQGAENQGVQYVDISGVASKANSAWADPKFKACTNGVKWHPSDKGMRLIAEAILKLAKRSGPPADGASPTASIRVQADTVLAPVNRKVLGHMVSGADGQYIWSSDEPDVGMRRTGWGLWDDQGDKPQAVPTGLIKALRPGVVRYPGGSAVKNYNWKATVGPYDQRDPNWRWGLMEYLRWCQVVRTEPQICLSSYYGTPRDQRDLVEFLNAPAIPENPWAMKRAEYGHPKPYQVTYFELGNEPYDGNRRAKPGKQWNLDGYIGWARKTVELIRQVDADVILGLPLWTPRTEKSNRRILREVGPLVDYIVHHTYSVMYAGNLTSSPELADRIARSCMAAPDQFEQNLKAFHQEIRDEVGRDLPIGITEYNASIKSRKPYVYRKSLAAGLFCLDYAFKMMKPENNILLANYWQIFSGYWGSFSYKEGALSAICPPYVCYRLVGDHIQDDMVASTVACPTVDFEGFCAVKPAVGNRPDSARKLSDLNLVDYGQWKLLNHDSSKADLSRKDGVYSVRLKEQTGDHYPNFLHIPVQDIPAEFRPSVPGVSYELSFEAKWEVDKEANGRVSLGIGIMDGRGWSKAGSAIGVDGADGAAGRWRTFKGMYTPLQDTPSLALLARIKGGSKPTSGVLTVRNLRVTPWKRETFPAYPALTTLATRSMAGDKVCLFVINKLTKRALTTSVQFDGLKASTKASIWTVTGASASSDSGVEISPEKTLPLIDNGLTLEFPPHSITAIEISAGQ
jgi:alpha-N-arabinofuranosidase